MKEYVELEKADVDALLQRASEAETRLAALEKQTDAKFTAIAAAQAVQDTSIASLVKADADLAKRVANDEAVEAAHSMKLDDLIKWKAATDATVTGLKQADFDLDARLDKAEPVLVSLATRLDKNDAKDSGQDQTDAALAARAALLEQFKASVDKTIADYAARLAKLETPVVVPPVPKAAEPTA